MNFSQSGKIKWLSALMLTVTLVGCSPQANPGDVAKEQATKQSQIAGVEDEANNKNSLAEKNPNRAQLQEVRNPNYSVRAPQVTPQAPRKSAKQMADFIAQSVNRIPGVERSAVVVTGNTAIVGLDLKSTISGSRIDTIKYAAKETAEGSTNGMRAVVTADVDTVTRLRELMAGARQGRPIDSFGDEIADIISRLIPEV
jgi:YhcN/YlaJ family sporulation lipoprotein